MTMTRKDFELVADAIAESVRASTGHPVITVTILTLAVRLADALAEEYPRFDRSKFLARVAPNRIRTPAADEEGCDSGFLNPEPTTNPGEAHE